MFSKKLVGKFTALIVVASLSGCATTNSAVAENGPFPVKISGGDVSIVPHLALALGNFEKEGLDVSVVDVGDYVQPHYKMQEVLNKGDIDASVHWFQHTVYGAANDQPVKAVMVLNDAPGATVMVANRVREQIRSGADFRGRKVAEGAGYATKSILTNLFATRSGLPLGTYTPVMIEVDGREAAVIGGLKAGTVDVMTFLEPMTSALKATGEVTTLYDLTTREATTKALGAPWPAQSVFLAPAYIRQHPDRVQRITNALVRTMRFVNSHTPEEIAARLPDAYFVGKDRATEIAKIRNTYPTYAKGDYSFTPEMVHLAADSLRRAPFDTSVEGQFRARAKDARFDEADLYTNQFVERAMKRIP